MSTAILLQPDRSEGLPPEEITQPLGPVAPVHLRPQSRPRIWIRRLIDILAVIRAAWQRDRLRQTQIERFREEEALRRENVYSILERRSLFWVCVGKENLAMRADYQLMKTQFYEMMGLLSIEEIIMNRDLGPVLERISRLLLILNDPPEKRKPTTCES